MQGLTVARINWEFTHRIDPDRVRTRRRKLKGRPLWVIQVTIDLQRLLAARGGRDPIIKQYLARTDLIWRGTSTTIGAEVELALAERLRLGITSLRPYDVPWRVCRRLTKLARNSRKKLRARDKRRAAGIRPLSESLSRTKPWLAEGIGRSTWFARRRNATKTELDDCVPPPSETRDAAHSSPSKIEEDQPMVPELPKTEPKPNHFRGVTMEQLRPDDLKNSTPTEGKSSYGREIPMRDRARGHWQTILPELGIDNRFLKKNNGPCPMCGGKDRWRFSDIDGAGTWWCNNCQGGDGFTLAMKVTNQPFTDVAKRIDSILGAAPMVAAPARSKEPNRAALNALWQYARPIEPDDPVDRYLTGRGITIRDYPRCLRFVRQAKHADGTVHPAMLAAVLDTDGKPATIHKTYLTIEGQKAAVDRVRLFCPGSRPEGGAVRLAAHGSELGIAEGIETALSASQLHGIPVWAALDAGGLERFIPPPEVTRLLIFGDHDANFAGHKAAYCLAMRAILVLKIKVEVRIPDRVGADWNDVLRGVQP